MTDILQIRELNKSFGKNKVIDGISLTVPEGSVFGFIGENGAGKTTTMKMILGLLRPEGGEISVCGENVIFGKSKTNRFIGYLPDVPEFYNYMRPREYLRFCGEVTGAEKSEIKNRSDRLIELVGLGNTDKRIGSFSRGMKQRLGVAQALINKPRLLICDEPTSALDPLGRKEILEILRQIRGETTVIFSTHILSDVERICDRAAVLHGGKIKLEGTLAELKKKHHNDGIRIEFASPVDKEKFLKIALEIFGGSLGEDVSASADENELIIRTKDLIGSERVILRVLFQNDIMPSRLEVLAPSIENLFIEAVK